MGRKAEGHQLGRSTLSDRSVLINTNTIYSTLDTEVIYINMQPVLRLD